MSQIQKRCVLSAKISNIDAQYLTKISTESFLGAFVFVVVFDYAEQSCIERCITKFTEAEFSMETVQCSLNSQALI